MSTGFLRGIKKLHGQPVEHINDTITHDNTGAENAHIVIDYEANAICFRLQNGADDNISKPGCKLECVVEAVRVILESQTSQYPCDRLDRAAGYLDLAIKQMTAWSKYRHEHGAKGCIEHRRDGESRCDK